MAEPPTTPPTPPPPPPNDPDGSPAPVPSAGAVPYAPPPPTAPTGGGWFAPIGYDPAMITARPVRWGMGDAVIGLILAQVFAIVGSVVVLLALGLDASDDLDEALTIGWIAVLQAFLWLGYGVYPVLVARLRGNGLVADFGWRFRVHDVWQGLLAGVGLQIIAVPVLYGLLSLVLDFGDVSETAEDLVGRAEGPGILLLALVVVVGAPIIEEIFFRGLLLRAVQRRYGAWPAIVASAVVFMAVHLEPRLFPALLLVGLVTGWVTVRSGRLGPAIWIHVGFNAVTVVALVALS